MPHLVLLGDAILDNAAFTVGGPAIIDQLRTRLPADWTATLAAIDGSTTADLEAQLAGLPADATHLLLSVGGNDARMCSDVLDTPVESSADVLRLIRQDMTAFERAYREAIAACLRRGLPLVTCTIYRGAFPDEDVQRRVDAALSAFNDVIVRVAVEHELTVIDMRLVCDRAEDYANATKPSTTGGAKIAAAVSRVVAGTGPLRGARLVA